MLAKYTNNRAGTNIFFTGGFENEYRGNRNQSKRSAEKGRKVF